jgi:hypothetical protein
MHRLPRLALVAVGFVSLALGVMGIFLPVLPTTPFLLLALAAFAKGSVRLHAWLLGHPLFGRYIRDYTERRGIRLHVKIAVIALLWVSIGISALFIVPYMIGKIFLLVVAFGVTWHIASFTTLRKRTDQPEQADS